jgi:hypothetical protein
MSDKKAILPVCYISALAQLARFSPEAFEEKSDVVMGFLVKRILMLPSPVDAVRVFFYIHSPDPLMIFALGASKPRGGMGRR